MVIRISCNHRRSNVYFLQFTPPRSPLIAVSKILELLEALLRSRSFGDLQDIKSHCFTERPAFSNSYYISDLYVPEARTKMYAHVTMTFLKTVVLSDVVEIIPTYDNGPLHLHLLHDASENASSDRNVASEWAFLVNVSSFKSLPRCFETKTDIAAVSHGLPPFRAQTFLSVKKDRRLLLKRTLGLISHLAILKERSKPES